MDVFGYAGVGLDSRQGSKRKRFSEGDSDCVPAKRPLTEEAMAAFMHQLHLSTASSSVSPGLPPSTTLNITAITTCPAATTTAESTCPRDELQTRGGTPQHVSIANDSSSSTHRGLLTPPRTSERQPQPRRQGSAMTESLDLASPHPVHIRVTPATPPSSESRGSLSQEEDCEPMEQGPLPLSHHRLGGRGRGVVLDDVSSDSSDSEMPQMVWLAPELRSLAASQRHLLPAPVPVLNEIARNGMALVPWVSREQCLTRALARSQELAGDASSSEEDEEGRKGLWQDRDYSMN